MSAAVSFSNWQDGFLRILPAVQTHASIRFRSLRPERRAEAIQEAIASACISYQRLAARGRLHVARPGMIADFAVRFVRNGRHVGGHQEAANDVLSCRAQENHRLVVRSLENLERQTHGEDWKALAIARRNAPIPETAAFRIDFAHWLWTLTRRDRRILRLLIRGERPSGIANRLKVSPARISQLRRRYESDWRIFQRQALSDCAA